MEKKKRYEISELERLGKPVLWLLWRVYECWDLLYWDSIKATAGSIKRSKEEYEEKRKREIFEQDAVYILRHFHPLTPTFRRIHPIDARYSLVLSLMEGNVLFPSLGMRLFCS
jgi:hypothetical protein